MSSGTESVKLITAAGGIVEKRTPDGIQIALVYRELYGSEWALPKGKQEKGESLEQTALREVEEETGCAARIIEYGGCTRYYHGKSPKKVSFWKMETDGECAFIPSGEVKKVEWLDPQTAIDRLKHEDEKNLLRKLYGEP